MICMYCGGIVEWKGPLTNLTHTECTQCGQKNCQLIDDESEEQTNPEERGMTKRFKFKRDSENGMLIGPNGCHYESEAEAMYYDQLELCGCGRPEEVHQFLLDCMGAKCDEHENIIDYKKIVELVKSKPEVVSEFVLHFLDNRQLLEHGSSVYASWPTGIGEQFLEIGVMEEK